jgi:hypothetical protein
VTAHGHAAPEKPGNHRHTQSSRDAAVSVTPARIPELLLGLATVRPVFIWGAPGIGKSSLVREFAESLGLECVSLLDTQLAPEDLIGVPQIREGRSVFCPPEAIARDEPYGLFLDELNAATPDELPASYPDGEEEQLAARWRRDGLPAAYEHCGTAGDESDQLLVRWAGWAQPPDHQLARWFDEFVPSPQPVRSYARPSRRQSATPDIPRAGHYFPPQEIARCTFGVVLDTSGSMDRTLLGKALGAIASYAEARDVPAARVVFCDAAPHDAGYVPVTEIAGRVRVHGRGGTVLQPGIDLLHRADDFPPGAPVLVITDGWCDVLRVRREHAYLIPQGARLPFTARGPVFRVQ